MLVPFAIDVKAVAPDPSWTPSDVDNHHASLLGIWRRLGLVCVEGVCVEGQQPPNSQLMRAVAKLPQSVRDQWQSLLSHLPILYCGDQWNGEIEAEALGSLPRRISLAMVDDVVGEIGFGIPEGAQSITSEGGIEIRRFKAASGASNFESARELAGRRIRVGEPYAEIWASRFRNLAEAPIQKITIVDRYALEQQLKCPQAKLSGLHRFLRELDRDASGDRYVRLYSSRTRYFAECTTGLEDVKTELRQIIDRLPHKRIKRLTVHFAPDHLFGRLEHGRYVRFDNYIWEIDGGLEVLEGAVCERASNATFKTGEFVQGYRDDETQLRNAADTQAIKVLV
jgi:hypothetical protein